ncbi:plastocyanin/azurin family copper-binding protein [Natrinema altunense]|uniref:Blue copper domain-containing protein n=1 Tax=Natrinema altunense (strain JCM 12890 / CGMCC 1.3731 / AJ2) TaxID=1227494 RepID=L9ZKH2_NATA2|nr:plastocyanin/azurin family copper-binding protein [Natrinema altunense]ELY87000.1 blue copper domain-containing protein [Natrinema altunense JCM 12890]
MLQLTGVAASTAFIAGCGGGGNGNGNGNGNGGGGGNGDGFEIEPGTTIDFSGETSHWEGLAPSAIEGEENPTLILQEGEDYTIGWSEGNGQPHNMEIRNESDEVIGDLSTEVVSEPDENQMLDITASSEMYQYVCQPHEAQMRGDMEIAGGTGGGGGNETAGNETGDNETSGNETGDNETSGNETSGNESDGNESGNETSE